MDNADLFLEFDFQGDAWTDDAIDQAVVVIPPCRWPLRNAEKPLRRSAPCLRPRTPVRLEEWSRQGKTCLHERGSE